MKSPFRNLKIMLHTAAMLAWFASPSLSATAHDVSVTLNGLDPITKTLIPAFGDLDIYESGVFMTYCVPIYRRAEEDERDLPDELEAHLKDQEPELQYGELPDSQVEFIGWNCDIEPFPWTDRFYCRDWSAVFVVDGSLPIDSNTFSGHFGDDGRLSTAVDLDATDFTVTLMLVGNRVENLGCEILHPFNETVIYAVDINVEGLSGSIDVTLAATNTVTEGVTNSTIYIETIDQDSLELDVDRVTLEMVSNNQIDELLRLTPPGSPFIVPLVFGVTSLAWISDNEIADVVLGLGYGVASGDCGNTEDCLVDVVEGILESGVVLSNLTDDINAAIAVPLSLSTNLASGGVGANINALLSDLASSESANSMTGTWTVSVTNTTNGACANGLTGFTAPLPGPASAVNGDVDFTVPFSLIGDAAQVVLRQVNFCTNYSFGPFSGSIHPNGSLGVARGGPARVDLTLPALLNSEAPGANGTLTFDVAMYTRPGVTTDGNLALELTTLFITNLIGTITTFVGPTIATYNFGPEGATMTTPAGDFPAPNIATNVETAVNRAIGGSFPIPFVYRGSVYVAPHVYAQPDGLIVDSGSISLGMDIMDGSTPVDVAVVRVEGVAPYTEMPFLAGAIRQVPVAAIIRNRDAWNVAPPTDVTIEMGLYRQVVWLPPLQPGEEFAVPFTISVGVDENGSVNVAPTAIITADILGMGTGESTIYDPNRENNVFELTIDDDWFRSDYTVEIEEISALLGRIQGGETIITSQIVSAGFTVTARVRNIGGEGVDSFTLRRLNVYVDDTFYAGVLIGGLEVGEEREAILEFQVPDGPAALTCTYDFRAELVAGDKKGANDRDYASVAVESSDCVGGGPTDADLDWIEEHGDDLLEATFEGTNQVTWGNDAHGTAGDVGPNAPILDRLEPLP